MKTVALLLAVAASLTSMPHASAAATRVGLKLVADGVVEPLSFNPLPGGGALVADQVGQIRLWQGDGKLAETPVLDLAAKLSKINHGAFDERGLLCLALHPGFKADRRVFATYTAPRRTSAPADFDCTLRVSEFTLPAGEPMRIDPASERVVFEVDKPYFNHNGGRIAFGPDGMLYISVGDGGGPKGCDIGNGHAPEGNGQNLRTPLAKILRIDVDARDEARGTAYRIPKDNPFADGKDGLPEIYAYGVRNPWAMTFDRGGSRQLYVADVGQMRWEEVDVIVKGGNYGWPLREGFDGFDREHPELAPTAPKAEKGLRGEPLIDPIAAYKNVGGFKGDPEVLGNSVTGGFVYRGKALPELAGHYIYGDWSGAQGTPQGRLFVARRPSDGKGRWTVEPLRVDGPGKLFGCVTAFGEDDDGEIYVLTNGSTTLTPGRGKIWRIIPAPVVKAD
jgi:glucose/arabinose dehydrogenase